MPVVEWPPLRVAQCPQDDREKHGSSERGLSWAHYQILLEFIYFDDDVMKEWEKVGGMQKDTVYESNSISSLSSVFTAVAEKSGGTSTSTFVGGGKGASDVRKKEIASWPSGLYKNGIPFKEDDIMVMLEDDVMAIKDIEGTLRGIP